jgi:hypothetical protein
MSKKVSRLLDVHDSVYINVKRGGDTVIRVSNHLPVPERLVSGSKTKKCDNIYFIFVKSKIDISRKSGARLATLIQLKESKNETEKLQGEAELNNLIVKIGNDSNKSVNYMIVNNPGEADAVVEDVKKMLKTSVFVPLQHIIAARCF